MYGLIGKIIAISGCRDELIGILIDATGDMPGCLSYIIARDVVDENAVWITEVWDSQASHAASLSLPAVQQAVTLGRPLMAGFGERIVTDPVGGYSGPLQR